MCKFKKYYSIHHINKVRVVFLEQMFSELKLHMKILLWYTKEHINKVHFFIFILNQKVSWILVYSLRNFHIFSVFFGWSLFVYTRQSSNNHNFSKGQNTIHCFFSILNFFVLKTVSYWCRPQPHSARTAACRFDAAARVSALRVTSWKIFQIYVKKSRHLKTTY